MTCKNSLSSSRFALHELSWLIGLAFGASAAQAQTVTDPAMLAAGSGALKEVVVSASRSEQAVDELPVTIDVLNADDIERGQVLDIRDAAKSLPNVSVRRAPVRFGFATGGDTGRDGNAGFNIRGLDGNRVLMLVDGFRIPRSYTFNVNAFGRDMLSIDLVKRIEFVKGPASVLYGSDGIAGLVNFITWEPSDFLKDGKTMGGRVSSSYSGDDKGASASATLAARVNEMLDVQFTLGKSRNNELANMGTNQTIGPLRTSPNPQTDSGNSVLAKAVLRPTAGQKHVFTYEHVDKQSDYDLLTSARSAVVLKTDGNSTMNRDRFTWNARYRIDSALADHLQTVLGYQNATSNEFARETRTGATPLRTRDNTYQERTLQASIHAGKALGGSGVLGQKLTYGVDYTSAQITNLVTGVAPTAPETFPVKRFPDTRETSSAFYVQDELAIGNWNLTPGIRVDHFSIAADQAGFNATAVSLAGSAVTPKFGALYRVTPQWSVFGNYAGGFRAPNAGQVNAFFENAASFYRTIPNAKLKPEKSRNLEAGVRRSAGLLSLEAAVFYGRFTNLIQDNATVSGAGVAGNPFVYQSVNVDNATIKGFELKGAMDWGRVGAGRLSMPFFYGQTKGTVTNTGLPLDTIDPSKLGLGVKYETAAVDVRLDALSRSAKKIGDVGTKQVGTPLTPQFEVPAVTTLDLSGQWRLTRSLRLNASVVNLTNRKYWNWSDVRGVAANSPVLDAYTQPGRKVNVSLVADF
ncbi:MAG: TonB-dependent hemoglobin/transferrin/lactoferrin family receptor [Polaromonas sp.]|nr:TonB-dependent hemoglobin/transferrin/lactoferrin family receptor [Polaromonas sp.]